MNIQTFDDLLNAARNQPVPQRLLFVFSAVELPDDATDSQRLEFDCGEGGALVPLMCVDKAPAELADFGALVAEGPVGVTQNIGEQITFWVCATLAVIGAGGTVLSRKAVHSALFIALTIGSPAFFSAQNIGNVLDRLGAKPIGRIAHRLRGIAGIIAVTLSQIAIDHFSTVTKQTAQILECFAGTHFPVGREVHRLGADGIGTACIRSGLAGLNAGRNHCCLAGTGGPACGLGRAGFGGDGFARQLNPFGQFGLALEVMGQQAAGIEIVIALLIVGGMKRKR